MIQKEINIKRKRAMTASQLTEYRDSLLEFRTSRDMDDVDKWVWLPKLEAEILMLDKEIKRHLLTRHAK
jgi:hypothetical protein